MLDLNSLNEAQREAVMHGSGPLLVLAGPGSGKTFTITQRIFFLIEKAGISPENILVITFTKDAALSMQSRFQAQSTQTLSVNFGTFHSVFYHILRESNAIVSHQLLTDAQKKKLMIPILKQHISRTELQYRQNDLSEEAMSVLSAVSYLKNTGDSSTAAKRLTVELQPHFTEIYDAYERARKREKAIDFDDMVYECGEILKRDAALRQYWQKRFSHILVDEFQDINPMQYEVLRLLTRKPYNLFVVGDDDQSIYGFRGSHPDCLKRFTEEFHAGQIYLNINYRSREEIVKASLMVISENKNRFCKELFASPAGEGYDAASVVTLRGAEEREQQYEYLVSRLQEAADGKSIGVLFRTNSYMQGFAARLCREGIPYMIKEKTTSIYEHFIIRDIMAYLKLAYGQGNRAMLLQIMNKPSRYISREALGLGEELPTFHSMIHYYQSKQELSRTIQVIQNIELLQKQMHQLKGMSPYLAVQYIRRVVGYDAYLKEISKGKVQQLQEWMDLLDWFCADGSNYDTVPEWMEAQCSYTEQLKENGSRDAAEKQQKPRISLMTVHASKGLEFDRVYIPDCNEKVFPHGNMPEEKECEEERRIFYVAMTRAKESLELLYLTGTKERPRLPSRFLNPLWKHYSSTNSSNSQLSRYSSKASATFSYSSSSAMYSSSGSSLGSSGFSL